MKQIITTILIVSSVQMFAQKYGFIDSGKLIMELPEVQAANKEVEALKAGLTKQGQDLIVELQKKAAQLEAKRPELAPVEFEKQAEALKKEQENIRQFEEQSQKQLIEKSNTLLGPIEEKVNAAIKAVATENGYSYIFDRSMGLILYADPIADISDKVKAKLGN
jgi:outer membrane protein